MSNLETIRKFAAEGRGLWVGLFIPTVFPTVKHPVAEFLPDDAHVTLLHLGKQRSITEVTFLADAVAEVWRYDSRPLDLELTGIGWFYRRRKHHPVGLVNSPRLFAMRAALIENLRQRGMAVQDQYGFIPHVSLRTDFEGDIPTVLAQRLGPTSVYNTRFEIPLVHIICGDGKMSV